MTLRLEVEDERHLQFRAIYQCLETSVHMLLGEWGIESLRDLYLKDREEFKEDHVILHGSILREPGPPRCANRPFNRAAGIGES